VYFAPMKEGIFYGLAKEVEEQDSQISIERSCLTLRNSEAYIPWFGTFSNLEVLEVNLNGEKKKNISVVSSPEAEAVSGAGCFIPDMENRRLKFVLPRFHLGVPAQLDMEMAVYQMAHSRIIKESIKEAKADNSGIIYFAREGHLTQMQKAIFLSTRENLPTTMVSISHQPADNEYSRKAYFASKPNLEGFPVYPQTLFLCDPVASGMQHVAMIEKLEEMKRLPKKIVVIAPMATKFGLQVIERACKEKGVEFEAGVAGVILDTQPPLRYYSPYPKNENQAADVDLFTIVRGLFGDKLSQACIRCNWTGTFWGGDSFPMKESSEELINLGFTNKDLLDICEKLTEQEAIKMDVMEKLLPYSTKILLQRTIG
jgi:hypothetical protein